MKRREIKQLLKKALSEDFLIMKGSLVEYRIPSGKKGYIKYPYLSFRHQNKTHNRYVIDRKRVEACVRNYQYVKQMIEQIAIENIAKRLKSKEK